MIRLLTDEDFNARITAGLLRRMPELDLLTAQQAGLTGQEDADILAWAAEQKRVVLSHDVTTMPGHVEARLQARSAMAGLILVVQRTPIGTAIEDILILAVCTDDDEWNGQVMYVPL
jgi:hypothetical protein